MLEREEIEAFAMAVRARLGAPVLAPVPLHLLAAPLALETVHGPMVVHVRTHVMLPLATWGMTTFAEERATIWLNREAWPELAQGIPRTRFTVAHELGHVVLHGAELEGLDDFAEPDHQEQLEREANAFAAHLLIPDAALKRLSLQVSAAASDVLAKRFGVSAPMAGRRIEEWRATR